MRCLKLTKFQNHQKQVEMHQNMKSAVEHKQRKDVRHLDQCKYKIECNIDVAQNFHLGAFILYLYLYFPTCKFNQQNTQIEHL